MKHNNDESPSATLFSASPHGLHVAEIDSCLVRQQCKLFILYQSSANAFNITMEAQVFQTCYIKKYFL